MPDSNTRRVKVIDSHTGGEPTRVVISGGPDLGSDTLAIRLERFRTEHDDFRSAIVNEPRGSDAIVGALLCEPLDNTCVTGVIYFNNVAYLGMCGHGTIGVVATLAYLGRIGPGRHRIETPVGVVTATLEADGTVEVANVPSYRLAADVAVHVIGLGPVIGDVAWGGNWFFLVKGHGLELSLNNLKDLTDFSAAVRESLASAGITGADGHEIDHIELFGPSEIADSKNFVLCPGSAYDRSPCGTGTSAKLACLFADGKLSEAQVWRQESIVGSVFEGRVSIVDNAIHPHIKGSAFITAESELILDLRDPFCMGIR
ncbi:MAG TPA: proline racemase family protein [Pyrinomonadaceae bacterium]|jgi:4-hydroxyproline epimerase|nr:proline racemase family protein [Pyrinomonadaceae bacterium]